jgi:subtilisin family serine protease
LLLTSCTMLASVLLFISIQANAQDYVPGELIVRMKGDTQAGKTTASAKPTFGKSALFKSMTLKHSYSNFNLHHFALAKGQSVEAAVQELKSDPTVQYVEPNYLFRKSDVTGLQQTFSTDQVYAGSVATGGVSMATAAPIDLSPVWSLAPASNKRPIVAIIDTGLDITHNVFQSTGAVWTNPGEIPANGIDDDRNGYVDDVHGWNFVANSPSVADDEGHGTHCAGIVLSVDQNIFSPTLRAAKIQIMPLKFMDASGVGSTSAAILAIDYALNNGASVLSNSWGGPSYSAALQEAIADSYNKGAVFVAAAGNAASDNDAVPQFPSSYDVPNVLAIAATTDADDLASFSNFGEHSVQLASPGVYILSTLPANTFGTMSGTSMATPFVAGTAAQMLVGSPSMLGHQVREILLQQNTPVAKLFGRVSTSARLDVAAAVKFAMSAPVETTQPAYSFDEYSRQPASSSSAVGGCSSGGAAQNSTNPFANIFSILALLFAQVLGLMYLRYRAVKRMQREVDSQN